jgi:hypothetical protein
MRFRSIAGPLAFLLLFSFALGASAQQSGGKKKAAKAADPERAVTLELGQAT